MKLRAFLAASLAGLIGLFAVTPPGQIQAQPTSPPAANMLLWLDASDPDGDGIDGNNPGDGSELSTWIDKSGNGYDGVIYTGKAGGSYETNEIGGRPVVRFDNNNATKSVYRADGLDLRASTYPKVTLFTVYRVAEGSPDAAAVWGNDNGLWDRFFYPVFRYLGDGVDDGLVSLGPQDEGEVVTDAGIPGRTRLLAIVYNGEIVGGQNNGPVNGSQVYFDGQFIRSFTDTTSATEALTDFSIGWDGDGGPFHGDVAEIIVYENALSEAEMQPVFCYLGAKYDRDFGCTPEPTPTVTATPADSLSGPKCLTDVDMAVSPQFITLAPGGEATVNVAVRNTNDELQGFNDILVSFSDGLEVTAVSEGGIDLGVRAAWQKFDLEPNETHEFAVTVRAAEQLVTAPLHITELYCGGRVLERIDGVFLAPTVNEVAPMTPVETVPTAAVPPLPQILPNTAEVRSGDFLPAVAALILLALTVLLRRSRS